MRAITLRCTRCHTARVLGSILLIRRYAEEPVHPPCPRCGGAEVVVKGGKVMVKRALRREQ